MEWVISVLIAIIVCWCGYSIIDYFDHKNYYDDKRFKDFKHMQLHNVLSYVTFLIIKWLFMITSLTVSFGGIVFIIKLLIFGEG